jgi:hypothetical protein
VEEWCTGRGGRWHGMTEICMVQWSRGGDNYWGGGSNQQDRHGVERDGGNQHARPLDDDGSTVRWARVATTGRKAGRWAPAGGERTH